MQSSGTRRVMSLCILLALVILLMQRASDPRHVRNAFQSLGVPLDPIAQPDAEITAYTTELRDGPLTTLEPSDGLSSASSASGQSSGTGQEYRRGASGHITTSTWQATCADVIPRILDSLTAAQQRSLAEFWLGRATAQPSGDSPPPDSLGSPPQAATINADTDTAADAAVDANEENLAVEWAEQGSAVIETLAEQTRQSSLSDDDKDKWLAELQEFASQWEILCTIPEAEAIPAAVSSELQRALTTAIDQRLLDDLRDAAPWTQSESLAFWRLLQRTTSLRTPSASSSAARPSGTSSNDTTQLDAPQPSPSAAPLVSMLQLDAEAQALRGRSVRFRGGVRRVERIERTYAPLHMQAGYWVLWLRGEDDASQPVAVYTTDPLAEQLVAQIDDRQADYPHIEVHGLFGKRVAYASPSGLQVGPALFASQLIPLRGAAPPLPAATPRELFSQFRWAVVVACLLAAAVVLPILWRNRRPLIARQPKANQPRARGSRRWWLLLLLCTIAWPGLIGPAAHVASAAPPAVETQVASPLAPPWATNKTDPLREFLQAAGVTPLSPTTADEVRASLRDRSSEFPDALLKAIYAIRRVGWVEDPQTLEPIDLGSGLALHGQSISGWVRAATPVTLDESQRAWFQTGEQTQLYQVILQVQVSDSNSDAVTELASGLLTIYCEHVPQMWLATAQLRQPARFSALALVDTEAGGTPSLCALATAPQWVFPGIVSAGMPAAELASRLAPPLPPYLLQLGQLGWDLSYLDTIASRSQQPLSRAEAPGFYSMLRLSRDAPSAVASPLKNSDAAQAEGNDTAAAQAMELLANARESVGKPVEWRVRIVTGTLVRVTQADDQRQLGGQAYIQYDGFVDIGNHRIRFQPNESRSADAQATSSPTTPPLEFSGEYPVTIVAPQGDAWELGEASAAGQESWSVGQYALVQGRFYRLWSYQSELVKSRSAQARQIAPLVVAAHFSPTTPPKRDTPANVGWFGWAMSAAMIAILVAVLWSATRKKRSLPA